jgi:hypothetical protein
MTRAWHFLQSDWTAGSGNEPLWIVGETRQIKQSPVLCVRGYHASQDILDALRYAPGPVACLVEPLGEIVHGGDKLVSQGRRLIAGRDCSRELRLFACDCAERALIRERDAGREPDPRSWAAIEVSRRYADGQATDDELAAARDAAWAAARDAERAWQRERLTWYLTTALGVECEAANTE